MTANPIIQNLRDSGFIIPVLTTYTLLPEGTMNAEQEAVYNLVYNSKNTEELQQIHITADLSEYAIDAAVASGDFDKFKLILAHFPFKYKYADHVISDVIHTAARANLNEDIVIKMVEFLVEHNASVKRYEASAAAAKGYYQTAEYLMKHDTEIKPLNGYDLYTLHGDNQFSSFKWLLDHGYKVKKSLAGEILCQEKLWNMNKIKVFSDETNVQNTIDFLIETGITTQDKVEEIKSNCELAVEAIQSNPSSHLVASYIKAGASTSIVQFILNQGASMDDVIYDTVRFASLEMTKLLIDNGASLTDGGKIGLQLVNHHSTEIVQYIVDEMAARKVEMVAGYEDYPKYIVSYIARDMDNCEGNKIIADYAGVTNSIDWSSCETDL